MIAILKYAHLLSLVVWIGGMVFFSFIGAPAIFRTLDRKTAGDVVGAIFPTYFALNAGCGVVAIATLTLLGLKTQIAGSLKTGLIILGVMLAISAYSGLVNGPEARRVKAEIRQTSDEARLADLKKQFGKLHGVSMALNILTLLLGLGLLYQLLGYLPLAPEDGQP